MIFEEKQQILHVYYTSKYSWISFYNWRSYMLLRCMKWCLSPSWICGWILCPTTFDNGVLPLQMEQKISGGRSVEQMGRKWERKALHTLWYVLCQYVWTSLRLTEYIMWRAGESYITDAFGAVVGLELGHSCWCVSRDTRTVVAAHCVGAVPPVPADISHVPALIVICEEKIRWERDLC